MSRTRYRSGLSGLERAKDQNPFSGNFIGGSTSFNTNYFPSVSKNIQELSKDNNPFEQEEDKGKSFLSKAISGGLEYFKKSQEKSDTDKLIDFAKSQQGKAQFGDNTSGFSSEVADGLNIFQPPSPNQMMFIPGKEGTGKSFTQRLAGGAAGLLSGLKTGIPHAGGIGAVAGFFG